MAASKQDAAKAQELAEQLLPGTNIIARVKGYPAWPAVVVNEKDVPSPVRKAKPSKKIVVPVLFYNDNSFLWISPFEGDILTPEQATKNSKAKVKRTLKDAYAIAANPPHYKKLVAIATGTTDPSEVSGENESGDAQEGNETPPEQAIESPAPRSRRARSAAEKAQSQLPARPKAGNNSSKKRNTTESPVPGAQAAPAPKKMKHAEISDGEEDSDYVDNGTEATDELSTSTETDNFNSEDLAQNQQARFTLCSSIRQAIQEHLLGSDTKEISDSQVIKVEESLKQLDDAPEIELSVVRRSKLVRVVQHALTIPELPGKLRDQLELWYNKWDTKAELVIRGIPEHLAPKEETEEPEEYDNSVDQSRDTTEKPESLIAENITENGTKEEEQINTEDVEENEKTDSEQKEATTVKEIEATSPPPASSTEPKGSKSEE